jgi:hypothetical protein
MVAMGGRRQAELDSRETLDEVEHGLLLHEGTGPFLDIVLPNRGRNVGDVEPDCACERARVVHDGGPVLAAFVVPFERGRSSVGNHDWSETRQAIPENVE